MERIGLAASKISKGNLLFYNIYVVLISSLFAFFVFTVTGATVVFALVLVSYLGHGIMGFSFEEKWPSILSFCMISLTIMAALFNMLAISRNVKLKKE